MCIHFIKNKSLCQTHYAATSCHPGGVIGAEPVLTSFQIKALPDPWFIVKPKPVSCISICITMLNAEESLTSAGIPVRGTSPMKTPTCTCTHALTTLYQELVHC